jgi:hypothetical protein
MDATGIAGVYAMDLTVVVTNYNGMEGLETHFPALCGRPSPDLHGGRLLDGRERPVREGTRQGSVLEGERNLGRREPEQEYCEKRKQGRDWFIDADMELIYRGRPWRTERLFLDPEVGMVGGMILTRIGEPYYWNYGYEKHPVRDRIAGFYGGLANQFRGNQKVWNFLRKRAIKYLYGMEIDSGDHRERVVEWVAEGSFLVRTAVFREVGGFDENMRYHEAHDLCKRIREAGY